MRLIDADALKDYLEDLRSYTALGKEHVYYRGETNALEVAIGCIDHAPTINAVPAVRGRYEEVSKILRSSYLRGLSMQLADALGNPCRYDLLRQLMEDYCEDRCIVDKDADCWLKLLQKWVKEYV